MELTFEINGDKWSGEVAVSESLLDVLRNRVGITSVKDGCAPQGQCGCCTVLIDGEPRVSCVTPASRTLGRKVTTVDGLPDRDEWADTFCATGASQCGFCTPGILVRLSAARARGKVSKLDTEPALAAHLCRCTGWQTIFDAVAQFPKQSEHRDFEAAQRRAELEGQVPQRVSAAIPLGLANFAADTVPNPHLVAIPKPHGSELPCVTVEGIDWVLGESRHDLSVGKLQGRNSTLVAEAPLAPPDTTGTRLVTSWVEPAYLETDSAWCSPGGVPADPVANGGAFGGKTDSLVTRAAKQLADSVGQTVLAQFAREDVVKFGPKRPPVSLGCILSGDKFHFTGTILTEHSIDLSTMPSAFVLENSFDVALQAQKNARTSLALRSAISAELEVLRCASVIDSGQKLADFVSPQFEEDVIGAGVAKSPGGAFASADVELNDRGHVMLVRIRVNAGDPLDETFLRSYLIGAAHMALGWVFTESLAQDPTTCEFVDLTIRSFGIIRPKNMPRVEIEIVQSDSEPAGSASDAAFAAVAAAAWNAVTEFEGQRPNIFPALSTAASAALRSP